MLNLAGATSIRLYRRRGQMRLDASVSRNELKTNDALNLKVKLTGTEILFVDNHKLPFLLILRSMTPKKMSTLRQHRRDQRGLFCDYVIIPRHAGTYTIPAFSCSYFDIVQIVKTSAGPFEITVEQGAQDASQSIVTGPARRDVRDIGSDIRFIQTGDLDLKYKGSYFFATPLFWTIYLLPLLLFVIFLILKRKQAQDRSDIVKVRNKRAAKLSRNRLKSAKNLYATTKMRKSMMRF